jgi:hypothetical protein
MVLLRDLAKQADVKGRAMTAIGGLDERENQKKQQ